MTDDKEKFREACHEGWLAYSRWLSEKNGREVFLDEREFRRVFDSALLHIIDQPTMKGDKISMDRAIAETVGWFKNSYQGAEKLVHSRITLSPQHELNWSAIRKLVARHDVVTVWCAMLRMSHLAEDFGEEEQQDGETQQQ